jgi:hypothetical protein
VVSITSQPLHPEERALDTHYVGGWLLARGGLDVVEKDDVSGLCQESNMIPRLSIQENVRYTK